MTSFCGGGGAKSSLAVVITAESGHGLVYELPKKNVSYPLATVAMYVDQGLDARGAPRIQR